MYSVVPVRFFQMEARERYGAHVMVLSCRQMSDGQFLTLMHDRPADCKEEVFLTNELTHTGFHTNKWLDFWKEHWGHPPQGSDPKETPIVLEVDEDGDPRLPIRPLGKSCRNSCAFIGVGETARTVYHTLTVSEAEMASGQKGRSPTFSEFVADNGAKLPQYVESQYLPSPDKPFVFRKAHDMDKHSLLALYDHLLQRQSDKVEGKADHIFRFKGYVKHGSTEICPALYTRDIMRDVLALHKIAIPTSLGGTPRAPPHSGKAQKKKLQNAKRKKAHRNSAANATASEEEIPLPNSSDLESDEPNHNPPAMSSKRDARGKGKDKVSKASKGESQAKRDQSKRGKSEADVEEDDASRQDKGLREEQDEDSPGLAPTSPEPDISHLDPIDAWEYRHIPSRKQEIRKELSKQSAPAANAAGVVDSPPLGSPASVDDSTRVSFLSQLWSDANYQTLCQSLQGKEINTTHEDAQYPWGSWDYPSEWLPPEVHNSRNALVQALHLYNAQDPQEVVADEGLLLHILLVIGMLARDIEKAQFCNNDPDDLNVSVPRFIQESVTTISDLNPLEEIVQSLADALQSSSKPPTPKPTSPPTADLHREPVKIPSKQSKVAQFREEVERRRAATVKRRADDVAFLQSDDLWKHMDPDDDTIPEEALNEAEGAVTIGLKIGPPKRPRRQDTNGQGSKGSGPHRIVSSLGAEPVRYPAPDPNGIARGNQGQSDMLAPPVESNAILHHHPANESLPAQGKQCAEMEVQYSAGNLTTITAGGGQPPGGTDVVRLNTPDPKSLTAGGYEQSVTHRHPANEPTPAQGKRRAATEGTKVQPRKRPRPADRTVEPIVSDSDHPPNDALPAQVGAPAPRRSKRAPIPRDLALPKPIISETSAQTGQNKGRKKKRKNWRYSNEPSDDEDKGK
ncbi:hypothetical protein K474DRAFT_1680640 [Panus rudis PR-1116 ss-1]|nr:hypothetical protein K474DRAFT_1680640 [Panus rudis PR-1116 ss-1]